MLLMTSFSTEIMNIFHSKLLVRPAILEWLGFSSIDRPPGSIPGEDDFTCAMCLVFCLLFYSSQLTSSDGGMVPSFTFSTIAD